jgi:hypothetical protein
MGNAAARLEPLTTLSRRPLPITRPKERNPQTVAQGNAGATADRNHMTQASGDPTSMAENREFDEPVRIN